MMKLETETPARREIDVIMLIDVVFLMLIFFLMAATIRPFAAREIEPASVTERHANDPIRTPLMLGVDGNFLQNDEPVPADEVEPYLRGVVARLEGEPLYIVADQNLSGVKLVDVLQAAKLAGASKIRLVTKRRRN